MHTQLAVHQISLTSACSTVVIRASHFTQTWFAQTHLILQNYGYTCFTFYFHRYNVLEVWWKVSPNTPPAWTYTPGQATGLQGGTNRLVEIGDSDGSPFGFCAAMDEFAPWPLR
jgi:hypothetical protein